MIQVEEMFNNTPQNKRKNKGNMKWTVKASKTLRHTNNHSISSHILWKHTTPVLEMSTQISTLVKE